MEVILTNKLWFCIIGTWNVNMLVQRKIYELKKEFLVRVYTTIESEKLIFIFPLAMMLQDYKRSFYGLSNRISRAIFILKDLKLTWGLTYTSTQKRTRDKDFACYI